ncbi:MAG TPA: GNAT family N-acetyltransferase [Desulfosporosinus sp.]|nr:GNAT family N-acetyltransferase [Desulfosporosinus sp.]
MFLNNFRPIGNGKHGTKMSDYPIEIRLKDGTPVLIRLLCQDDKEELKIGFEKLSTKSKYRRFFVPISSLSNSQLKHLTEIDNKNHLALCGYIVSQDGMFGIGVARYIRVEEEPETAEFALTIIDEYQSQGLGTELLNLLIHCARKNGIRKFVGYMLAENSSMLKILKHLGAQIRREDGPIQRVDLILSS